MKTNTRVKLNAKKKQKIRAREPSISNMMGSKQDRLEADVHRKNLIPSSDIKVVRMETQ